MNSEIRLSFAITFLGTVAQLPHVFDGLSTDSTKLYKTVVLLAPLFYILPITVLALYAVNFRKPRLMRVAGVLYGLAMAASIWMFVFGGVEALTSLCSDVDDWCIDNTDACVSTETDWEK
jgi:hypothetical protein